MLDLLLTDEMREIDAKWETDELQGVVRLRLAAENADPEANYDMACYLLKQGAADEAYRCHDISKL